MPFSIPLLPERLLCIARQWNISEIITDQRLGFEVVRIFCAHFILGFHVQLPADFLGCLFKGNPFLGDDGGDTDEVVAFRSPDGTDNPTGFHVSHRRSEFRAEFILIHEPYGTAALGIRGIGIVADQLGEECLIGFCKLLRKLFTGRLRISAGTSAVVGDVEKLELIFRRFRPLFLMRRVIIIDFFGRDIDRAVAVF